MTHAEKYERTHRRRYSYTLPVYLEGIRLSGDFERLRRASDRAKDIYVLRYKRMAADTSADTVQGAQ